MTKKTITTCDLCGEPEQKKDEAIVAGEKIMKKYSKSIKNLADK